MFLFAALVGGTFVACSSSPDRANEDQGLTGNDCRSCLTTRCAPQFLACNNTDDNQCIELANCYGGCKTASCLRRCDAQYPDGADEFLVVAQCAAAQCESECQIEGTGGTGGSGGSGGNDGGNSCTPPGNGGQCDTFDDGDVCGCTAAQNCVFGDDNRTVCVARGTTTPYAACDAETCGRGYACVSATCRPYCEENSDCEGSPKSECLGVDRSGQTVPGFLTCSQYCNPVDPRNTARNPSFGACGAGATCVPIPLQDGSATSDCVGLDPQPTCGSDWQCAEPGYYCIDGACKKYCRLNQKTDCADDETCTPLLKPISLETENGMQDYGFCELTGGIVPPGG